VTTSRRELERLASRELGYDGLRPGQEEALRSVVDGHDTLAVMPTGSGKSAIYQLAGIRLPGPTIVVSPLIALQRDQFLAMVEQDVAEVAMLNSSLPAARYREALDDLEGGDLEFLLLAPEQFARTEVLERLRAARPSLFVVDEAHCISDWGHDFRPAYLRLQDVIAALDHPTVLALTATAAPPVREEIVRRLGMREPRVVVRGFDRPNIHLEVLRFADEHGKRMRFEERIAAAPKPGIVYVATRRGAALIEAAGIRAAAYHAGMASRDRDDVQRRFMDDDVEVTVATTAFGMGLDKPNVRFVYHWEPSDSLDAYYQEVGRAGRDGESAEAVLFYRPEDLGVRRFFAGSANVDSRALGKVLKALHEAGIPQDEEALRRTAGLSRSAFTSALNRLQSAGAVGTDTDGRLVVVDATANTRTVARHARDAAERRRLMDESRVAMMQAYAELGDCRREFLLNYFGEDLGEHCGNCDNCESGRVVERDASAEPFPLESRVRHRQWGPGLVMRYEGDRIVVLFEQVGYKTLSLELVSESGLLETESALAS
jgi:ATP-dependent DNA helicase RecQ